MRHQGLAREALSKLDAALASADPASFEECFDPHVVFIGSGAGEEATSRDELLTVARSLAVLAESATFDIDWLTLDATVDDHIALVAGHGVVRASGSLAHLDGTQYRVTGVLIRVADSWRWRVYHGSEPSRMRNAASSI
jgi:hypothetical protein